MIRYKESYYVGAREEMSFCKIYQYYKEDCELWDCHKVHINLRQGFTSSLCFCYCNGWVYKTIQNVDPWFIFTRCYIALVNEHWNTLRKMRYFNSSRIKVEYCKFFTWEIKVMSLFEWRSNWIKENLFKGLSKGQWRIHISNLNQVGINAG